MKRFLLCFLVLAILFSLCGCESVLDGEVAVIQPYSGSPSQSASTAPEESVVLNTDEEFKLAVEDMIANGETEALFRIPLSDDTEKREAELSKYCQSIALNTPLGAYAVYYITCKLTPIVSYYNAGISITYKRSTESIQAITHISSARYLGSRLLSSMAACENSLTFFTSMDNLSADFIRSEIQELYWENPLSVAIPPESNISAYPASTGERIVEIEFTWAYTQSVLLDMQTRLLNSVDDIVSHSVDTGDYGLLSSFRDALQKRAVMQEPASVLSDTAYGVLVGQTGTPLGFSLAFKALCDRLGISCQIVNGLHNGREYYWNLVNCDGNWYHVDSAGDTSALTPDTFLFGDSSMQDTYSWATEEYPACPSDYFVSEEEALTSADYENQSILTQ